MFELFIIFGALAGTGWITCGCGPDRNPDQSDFDLNYKSDLHQSDLSSDYKSDLHWHDCVGD